MGVLTERNKYIRSTQSGRELEIKCSQLKILTEYLLYQALK